MLVKLKNDWFDGQTYRKKGVAFEYQGKEEDLPNGAVVLSEKPVEEQMAFLDTPAKKAK